MQLLSLSVTKKEMMAIIHPHMTQMIMTAEKFFFFITFIRRAHNGDTALAKAEVSSVPAGVLFSDSRLG